MNFPTGLLTGWSQDQKVSLGEGQGQGHSELDTLKRRVHELHVQNETLVEMVANERLAKQNLTTEVKDLHERLQAKQASTGSSVAGSGLAGVFGLAGVSQSGNASLEVDMLRNQLSTLREAYEELQREKEGEKRGADEDVEILQEQLKALRRACKQLQEEKGINNCDGLLKAADKPPPPPPPPPPASRRRETDSDDDEPVITGLNSFVEGTPMEDRATARKLAGEMDRLKIVEAALRQNIAEAEGRAQRLQSQLDEHQSARRLADEKASSLETELEQVKASMQEEAQRREAAELRQAEMSGEVERLQAGLLADQCTREAAEAHVAELEMEVTRLRAATPTMAETTQVDTGLLVESKELADVTATTSSPEETVAPEETPGNLPQDSEVAEAAPEMSLSAAGGELEKSAAQPPEAASAAEASKEEGLEQDQRTGLLAEVWQVRAAREEECQRRLAAERRVFELNREVDHARVSASEAQQKHSQELAAAKARVAELVGQMDRLRSVSTEDAERASAAKASIAELTAELEQLRTTEAQKSAEVSRLQDALAEEQGQREKLSKSEAEATGKTASLEKSVAELTSALEEQRELVKANEAGKAGQLEEAQAKVESLQRELCAVQEQARVAELAHSESRAAVSAAADIRIAELVAELDQVKASSFVEVQARERELKQVSEQLQKEVQSLRADLEQTEEQRRGLTRRLRDLPESSNMSFSLAPATGSFLAVSGMHNNPGSTGGMMYMLKIEELEAENARLQEQVHGASALYVPKIQELEGEVNEGKRLLEDAWESQGLLQADVAAKAALIRDLLRRCGYVDKGGGTLTRLLRVMHRPWRASGSGRADQDPSERVEELERALEKALLELAKLHDELEGSCEPKGLADA